MRTIAKMSDEAIQVLRSRVLSIPADLKALFPIVDDGELTDELRTLAASAIFYNLNPANIIPAKEGMLGFADDAIAIRCALDEVRRAVPERARVYAEGAPETWEGLEHEMDLLGALLGEWWQPLRATWRTIGMLEWHGKKAANAVSDAADSAWLYAAVEEALALRDVEEHAVVREVRKEPLLAKLAQRLSVRKK
ncbi:MAG: hypothetical protein NVS3B20_13580 [Polyangiales bacterium]